MQEVWKFQAFLVRSFTTPLLASNVRERERERERVDSLKLASWPRLGASHVLMVEEEKRQRGVEREKARQRVGGEGERRV
jgi:hypothetical protein